MHRQIAGLMGISLVTSTVMALLGLSQSLESAPATGASAADLGVVRSYVSDLNAFLGNGELDVVMRNYDPRAVVRTPNTGEDIDADSLKMALLAIRASYPDLTVTLADTRTDGNAVVAELSPNAVRAQTPEWIEFSSFEPSTPLIESFRIERGAIVEHQSSLLERPQARLYEQYSSQLTVTRRSRLTMAQMTLPAEQTRFVSVPGPAMILVREGSIEVAGGPADFLSPSPGLAGHSLETGVSELAGPGATIVSAAGAIALQNSSAYPATLDVIALTTAITMIRLEAGEDKAGLFPDERMSNATPWELSLADALLTMPGVTTRVDGISIVPVARSTQKVTIGNGRLMVAYVSLPPGSVVTCVDSDGLTAHMVLQPADTEHLEISTSEGGHVITNSGADQVRMLVARYDPL